MATNRQSAVEAARTREIKFRVWDDFTERMASGRELTITFRGNEIDHIWVEWEDHGFHYKSGSARHPLDQERYKVMQITGLTDRDGKDLWDGDIVYHHAYERLLEVNWNQDGCGWNVGDMALSKLCVPNLEIVGNRYEGIYMKEMFGHEKGED